VLDIKHGWQHAHLDASPLNVPYQRLAHLGAHPRSLASLSRNASVRAPLSVQAAHPFPHDVKMGSPWKSDCVRKRFAIANGACLIRRGFMWYHASDERLLGARLLHYVSDIYTFPMVAAASVL
jgi:hypothetical protein